MPSLLPVHDYVHFTSYRALFEDIEQLVQAMNKYRTYLLQVEEKMKERHCSPVPLRQPLSDSLLEIREANLETLSEYQCILQKLSEMNEYEPLHLLDFMPDDRFERRSWLQRLSLSVPFALYAYQHGNYLGTEHFVWKLSEERSDSKNVQAVMKLNEGIKVYYTRAMRKQFIEKYSHRINLPKMVLRQIYKELSGDSSASESSQQGEIDD